MNEGQVDGETGGEVDRETDADAGRESDIAALTARAATARERSESAEVPDEAAAADAARDGLGPVVARYIEARTGNVERLSVEGLGDLDRACNDWLVVYARRYGVECDPGVPVRTAAEALLDTHDIVATARVLTGVPAPGDG
ncbi:hypothetical protein [Halobaculum magnesiiphilum]|uniref:DUF8055 domain-containing protein n=1 Tax=Halobaculum magnesiiphilum TaxID=1017351 RepID=A0A8T8WDD1_9EURY|nr:hypothetical protein [Halobaculum magnesiiphilum]QZP37850.1 hypothetical protein K6T50_01340 [Halobaculum magnesiiphilum]